VTALLDLHGLTRRYGSVTAVEDVDLSVAPSTRHAIIGPNGAGKSTLFAMVAGTLAPSSGRVLLEGVDITRMRVHRRAHRGLVKTFQHSSVFDSMSVEDNVVLGTRRVHGGAARPYGRTRTRVRSIAGGVLDQVGLADRRTTMARELSHGERRQLELALALSVDPKVLLLDEPTAGMSARETERFVDLITGLGSGVTILIIEHDLDVVFSLADRVTVLHLGRVIADGTPAEVRESELVQQVYLGVAPDPTDSTEGVASHELA